MAVQREARRREEKEQGASAERGKDNRWSYVRMLGLWVCHCYPLPPPSSPGLKESSRNILILSLPSLSASRGPSFTDVTPARNRNCARGAELEGQRIFRGLICHRVYRVQRRTWRQTIRNDLWSAISTNITYRSYYTLFYNVRSCNLYFEPSYSYQESCWAMDVDRKAVQARCIQSTLVHIAFDIYRL